MLPYPLQPQLARLQESLPEGPEWLYEPKWDGFRCLVFKSEASVRLQSRNGKDLSRSFPELVRACRSLPDCVLDGELVAVRNGRQDFESLLDRLAGNGREPVSLVAFDAVAWDGADLRLLPFTGRRAILEKLPAGPHLQVSPQSADPEVASAWLQGSFALGFEGVVAKRSAQHYLPGQRCMVKVKHFETIDVVVGGYTGEPGAPRGLILGLYGDDGALNHVGTTSLLPGPVRAAASALVLSENRFGGLQPGLSRWPSHRFDEWVAVEPTAVCEIGFSRLDGVRFRHSVRFLRWRPDLNPASCTYEQLDRFRERQGWR